MFIISFYSLGIRILRMNKPKCGQVCAVKDCSNKSYNCSKSFFRFPSNINGARLWAIKCSREDLLTNLVKLNKSHRLCSDHFEPVMFTNHLHKRLNRKAVPTLFPLLKGSSREDHNYCRPPLMPPKVRILENRAIVPDSDLSASKIKAESQDESAMNEYEKSMMDIGVSSPLQSPNPLMETRITSPPMSSTSTQTSSSFFNSSRKSKYRNVIKNLAAKNNRLRKRVEQLKHQLHNPEENISLGQYKALTFKFCNSVDIAKFINIQVTQGKKHPKGLRYSKSFKHK